MPNKKARLHSAEHLLWEVLKEKYPNLKTEALEFKTDKVRIDYRIGNKDIEIPVEEIEGRVNALINQRLDITIEIKPRREAEKICDLSLVPKSVKDIRIVNIGDVSIEACAGEHVKNTDEIGKFKILETKISSEDKLRIYATVEDEMTNEKDKDKVTKIKPQTLKGFRDFLPEEMRVRNFVLDTMRKVFESFGFEPLETPSLEYASTLLGKYGEEADRLVYTFKDRGDREIGLIYDLTVPVSRVLATYRNEIPLPFKRYQIQRVWRAEKPQKGRYREFVQCDFDIFGVESPLADAEIIAVIYQVLKRLGLDDFKIRLNSRPLLFSILEEIGITEKNQQLEVLHIIDKLDRTPKEKVMEELEKKGLAYPTNGRVLNRLSRAEPNEELSKILEYLQAMGLEEKYYCFDPTLVRGLDYYTGPIFEAVVPDFPGSLAGGGRYDNLIESLGGPSIPATGCSLGLDRIVEAIQGLNPCKAVVKPSTQVLVTIFDETLVNESLKFSLILRSIKENMNIEVYPDPTAKLDKQIKYADRKGIPYVAILGPEEVENNTVTIKDLRTGEQETIDREDLKNFQFSSSKSQ